MSVATTDGPNDAEPKTSREGGNESTLTPVDPRGTMTVASASISGARLVARVAWGVALCAMTLIALNGYQMFEAADSAPQQCAAAAWACFQIIVPYVLARGLQEMVTA